MFFCPQNEKTPLKILKLLPSPRHAAPERKITKHKIKTFQLDLGNFDLYLDRAAKLVGKKE